jgi:hypothetical protein
MNTSPIVRDLQPHELPIPAAKTGDTLPDGSVLLWRGDMDRMGLEKLRTWLAAQARQRSVIAIGDVPGPRSGHRLEDVA